MDARIWMLLFSSAGREPVKRDPDLDRMTPRVGDTTVQEYWDGGHWASRTLTWDGKRYVLIVAHFHNPPVPIRSCDWSACVDGREEWLTGWGRTKEAAIADLLEKIEEEN